MRAQLVRGGRRAREPFESWGGLTPSVSSRRRLDLRFFSLPVFLAARFPTQNTIAVFGRRGRTSFGNHAEKAVSSGVYETDE
jgi:hypothetical protein